MLFKKPLQDLTDDEYDKLQEYAKEKLAIGGRVGLAEGMMASSNSYKNYVKDRVKPCLCCYAANNTMFASSKTCSFSKTCCSLNTL